MAETGWWVDVGICDMKSRKDHDFVRLLFMIDFISTLAGGTENQLVKLVNNLDKSVYNVHLICLRKSEWLNKNMAHLNCAVSIYDISRLRSPANVFTCVRILRHMRQLRPHIVMTFFPLSNILGVLLARLAKVKVIVSTRRDYGLWLEWIHERSIHFLRFANRFVTRILTNAQAVRRLTSKYENFDMSRIDVIYNGIDQNGFGMLPDGSASIRDGLGIAKGSKVIGIVGGLKPMKRHRTFLGASARVLQILPDAHFVIVGDGPLRSELEALASKLGIRWRTHFVGSQKNVVPYLSMFDIAVNCSANEGLSNAIMEYMACGVPCIVSAAGGNQELVEDGVNGYVFNLDNDRELAELIISLLDDVPRREQFAAKSREIILRRFTLEKMICDYEQYFKSLLEMNSTEENLGESVSVRN